MFYFFFRTFLIANNSKILSNVSLGIDKMEMC